MHAQGRVRGGGPTVQARCRRHRCPVHKSWSRANPPCCAIATRVGA